MPKQKTTLSQRKEQWIVELDLQQCVKLDGSKFVCQACNKGYGFSRKSELEQHKKTSAHIQSVHRLNMSKAKQPLIRDAFDTTNVFYKDLCEAFVAADIPFAKLENATLFNFLEKYTKQQIPTRQTLTNYLPKIHAEVVAKIREELGDSKLWVQVDEITDAAGRYVANVILGPLNKDTAKQGYLVSSKPLVSTNHATIVQAVLDSFQIVWPGMKQEEIDERFRILLTDGVNYMLKAGRVLKSTYPDLLHVTCLSHALNLVAEKVRAMFPNVDKLLASVKKVFKKAPTRILAFKEMNPDLNLPPGVVLTRWGSWLHAAEFYAQHFAEIKAVIETFDPTEAISIETAQTALAIPAVPHELAYISANFTFLCTPILELQARGAFLSSTLDIMENVRSKLQNVSGTIGKRVLERFDAVIQKNSDLVKIKAISRIINGDVLAESESQPLIDMTPANIASFKYAPMTTVEAERSFSMHKAIFSDRRQRMTVENLEFLLVSHFYHIA